MKNCSIWVGMLVLFAVATGANANGLFRWVDESGRVHYGDRLPPTSAESGHQEIDTFGRVKKEVPGAKSSAEREREAELKARRDADERARRERINYDRALLSTYTSIDDIERLRADRLGLVESVSSVIQTKVAKLEQDLTEALERREKLEASGKPLPPQLVQNIAEYERQMASYDEQLAANAKQRAEIEARFDRDRTRYLELKSEVDSKLIGAGAR
ncbi:MAG: DUF4124 domain-containing protein [Thiotrichales bacterium]